MMAGTKGQRRSAAGNRERMSDMARCGAALVFLVAVGGANALAEPQAFPSPEAAAQALRDALEAMTARPFGPYSARNTPTI